MDNNDIEFIIDGLLNQGDKRQICTCNIHNIIMATRDSELRTIINSASIATMDGLPLVWSARMLGCKKASRMTGSDLLEKIAEISVKKGYRHFFYGGADGVPQKLKTVFETKYPGIKIVGTFSPPFRTLTYMEDKTIVKMINDAKPHFLWVGLGAPKQEKYIYEHLDRIQVPIQIGIGAAFDFYSGKIERAPVWIQKIGFEWLHRLLQEPKRLWKRYLIYNTLFTLQIIPEILKYRILGKPVIYDDGKL
ncbi:MAG: WecB/TagA/CpsF family glycosyltransferase [Promethearchaeota archaeon]